MLQLSSVTVGWDVVVRAEVDRVFDLDRVMPGEGLVAWRATLADTEAPRRYISRTSPVVSVDVI